MSKLINYVKTGDVRMVKLLLKNGADPNKKSKFREIPLVEALQHKYIEIATLLVKGGADPNVKVEKAGSPLICTARLDLPDLCSLLLDKGADPNIRDSNGNTALIFANSFENGYKITQMLLKSGADPNIQSDYGFTPIMYAAGNGMDELVSLLIENGADLDIQSFGGGDTALIFATKHRQLSTMKLLIKSGANPYIKDVNGNTFLEYADKSKIKEYEELAESFCGINIKG